MESLCLRELFACLILSVLYVGSLYIWKATQGRDHPSTIKKRCISVVFMTLLSPVFILIFGDEETFEKGSIWTLMGLRWTGLIPSLVLPLLLTMVLFLGPIILAHQNVPVLSTVKLYSDPLFWYNTAQNPIWWRNQVVAPFSEEFTFRACMLPILLQCLSPGKAVFVAPLFFGVAHLHHIVERCKMGMEMYTVILISCFQFLYTSVFGFYSAFLFIRTAHFLPLFVVHAFCNHMGLPEVQELFMKQDPQRLKLIIVHFLGVILWYFLLYPMTEPSYYGNTLYSL